MTTTIQPILNEIIKLSDSTENGGNGNGKIDTTKEVSLTLSSREFKEQYKGIIKMLDFVVKFDLIDKAPFSTTLILSNVLFSTSKAYGVIWMMNILHNYALASIDPLYSVNEI